MKLYMPISKPFMQDPYNKFKINKLAKNKEVELRNQPLRIWTQLI